MDHRLIPAVPRLGAALLIGTAIAFASGPVRADKPRPATPPAQAPAASQSTTERAATGDAKADKKTNVNVVGTEENKEGVKTYKFGAVEVEGRLRSPQLTYFLRRVRAEFSAGDLGHRSFMRELAETTRHPAFR